MIRNLSLKHGYRSRGGVLLLTGNHMLGTMLYGACCTNANRSIDNVICCKWFRVRLESSNRSPGTNERNNGVKSNSGFVSPQSQPATFLKSSQASNFAFPSFSGWLAALFLGFIDFSARSA